MEKKKSMIISIIIFVIVIGILVFITVNNKGGSTTSLEQNNMQNSQEEGVKITIVQEGNGDIAKTGDVVSMNYTGKLADGTVFDSNIDPKFGHVQPFVFPLGSGEVIKGWDVGVVGMKIGEKRILEIAPEYAYGENGAGDVIPPNATITFEVNLLQIQK